MLFHPPIGRRCGRRYQDRWATRRNPGEQPLGFYLLDGLLAILIDTSLLLFGLLVLGLLYAAIEAGFQIGLWRSRRRPAHERDLAGIGTITAGMLGLLAFTLGLTINIAQARFDARRSLVIRDANAITTAWLRSKLVAGDEGQAITALIEAFGKVDLAYVSASSFEVESGLIARKHALQTQIWQQAQMVAQRDRTFIAASLITALVGMFDAAQAERFAFESRMPANLSWMLMGGSLLAIGAVGYHLGVSGRAPSGADHATTGHVGGRNGSDRRPQPPACRCNPGGPSAIGLGGSELRRR